MTGRHYERGDSIGFEVRQADSLASWHFTYPFSEYPLSTRGLVDIIEKGLTGSEAFFKPARLTIGTESLPRTDPVKGSSHGPIEGSPYMSLDRLVAVIEDQLSMEVAEGQTTVVSAHIWGDVRLTLPSSGGLTSRFYGAWTDAKLPGKRQYHRQELVGLLKLHALCEHWSKTHHGHYNCSILTTTDLWFLFRLHTIPPNWRLVSLVNAVELGRFMKGWSRVEGLEAIKHHFYMPCIEYPESRDPTTSLGALTEEEFAALDSIPQRDFTLENSVIQSILNPTRPTNRRGA